MKNKNEKDIDKKSLLKYAAKRLLRPFARLMISHGVTYREFSELIKQVYFDAGVTILQTQNKRITESQLAVLTGLHRKDISNFSAKDTDNSEKKERKHRSICSAIIAEWISNPQYLDKKKNIPLILSYAKESDKGPSFVDLVESISTDIRAKTVLEELKRLDMVTINIADNNLISLNKEGFVPTSDFKEKISFLQKNIGDHLEAAVSNIEGFKKPFFERSAFHTELTIKDIELLERIIQDDGMALLKKVYSKADSLAQKNNEICDDLEKFRVTCGVYFYSETKNYRPEDDN